MGEIFEHIKKVLDKHKKEKQCKGLLFRGTVTTFINIKGHIGTHKYLKLLKRKSCPGCDNCGGLMELIRDEIDNEPNEDWMDNIIDKKIYFPVIGGDYEEAVLDWWEEYNG